MVDRFKIINSTTFESSCEEVRKTVVGDSKSVDFLPVVEINPWPGDCLKVWKDTGSSLNRTTRLTDIDRLSWENWVISPVGIDKPVQIKDSYKWNGAQFVVTLTQKPTIDSDGFARFVFKMSGYQDMNFYPQPEFTQAEIDFGGSQPDWAIDSIAVYHKTKKNNDSTNMYKTGKVCHIKRCWCLDDQGNFTWGKWEFDLSAGTLTKCIPGAAFSYRGATSWQVDATFGNTSQGASQQDLEGLICGTRLGTSITEDGTGNNITVWLNCVTAAHLTKANLYLASDESQVTNGETDVVDVGTGADQEVSFDFTSAPSLTSGTGYDICAWAEAEAGSNSIYCDTAADEGGYQSIAYGSWPDPWVLSNWSRIVSIYVDYTAGGGAAGVEIFRRRIEGY